MSYTFRATPELTTLPCFRPQFHQCNHCSTAPFDPQYSGPTNSRFPLTFSASKSHLFSFSYPQFGPISRNHRKIQAMAFELAGTTFSAVSPAAVATAVFSSSALNRKSAILALRDLGGGRSALTSPFFAGVRPLKASNFVPYSRRRGRYRLVRRAFTLGLRVFPDESGEELVGKLDELTAKLQGEQDGNFRPNYAKNLRNNATDSDFLTVSSLPWALIRPEPPDWPDRLVPASVEKNANSVELPLSLRIIKRKKRWGEDVCEAGEAARCSVKRAFSSMVFMLRELQSTALQMREALFCEDLQGVLARVQRDTNSSFVWLFQQIFSCTPALMVSVMLLLANFTVYSMDADVAFAADANRPPSTSAVAEERQSDEQLNSRLEKFSFSTESLSLIGGNGGEGGKAKPVAGATDDGPNSVNSGSAGLVDGLSRHVAGAEEETKLWEGILDEVRRMKASTRDEALMERETIERLVAPVKVELEVEDRSDYLRTELMYHEALSREPDNVLLLSNFAQFLYLVLGDHDRAELYFKRAIGVQPADAEALSCYASFLWLARTDLAAAEETYLEAITADPGNTVYAGNYAHFLWNTGGDETCCPLDGAEGEGHML